MITTKHKIHTFLLVEESAKFIGLWWDSHLSFKKHISALKILCKEALNLIRVVAHVKWGGGRDTLLMLYRAIVRSKQEYSCFVYGTVSNTNLRQLDNIHNTGLRLALGAFCTSPVSSFYTKANEAPLMEQRSKLSLHFLKTPACIDNPSHHTLHGFDQTPRIYMFPGQKGKVARLDPQHVLLILGYRQPEPLQRSILLLFALWGNPTSLQVRMNMTQWDTNSLKDWANVWSPDKKPGANSKSIMTLIGHMMKFTQTDPR